MKAIFRAAIAAVIVFSAAIVDAAELGTTIAIPVEHSFGLKGSFTERTRALGTRSPTGKWVFEREGAVEADSSATKAIAKALEANDFYVVRAPVNVSAAGGAHVQSSVKMASDAWFVRVHHSYFRNSLLICLHPHEAADCALATTLLRSLLLLHAAVLPGAKPD